MPVDPYDEAIEIELIRVDKAVMEKLQRYGASAEHYFTDDEKLYYMDVILPTLCTHGGDLRSCAYCAAEKTKRGAP